jgi:virginiamycin B lyase
MNRSGRRSHLTALLTAILVCIGLLSLSSAPAWATAGTITEFPIPTISSFPTGITAGPDGNLWFTEFHGNEIGRITTAGVVTGEFLIPTRLSDPEGITAGPDGNLWFTESSGDKIGRISTS